MITEKSLWIGRNENMPQRWFGAQENGMLEDLYKQSTKIF
jgi:hypothetical protein